MNEKNRIYIFSEGCGENNEEDQQSFWSAKSVAVMILREVSRDHASLICFLQYALRACTYFRVSKQGADFVASNGCLDKSTKVLLYDDQFMCIQCNSNYSLQ